MLKFKQCLNTALSIITALALILMMLHIVANAVGRFFDAPIYGTNETVAFWYLPIVALLGIPAAQLQKEQIAVTLAVERMNPTSAFVFKVFSCFLGSVTSIGFAWFGAAKAVENMELGSTASVTDIITWPVYFLVPIVFILLATLFIIDIFSTAPTGAVGSAVRDAEKTERSIEDAAL